MSNSFYLLFRRTIKLVSGSMPCNTYLDMIYDASIHQFMRHPLFIKHCFAFDTRSVDKAQYLVKTRTTA